MLSGTIKEIVKWLNDMRAEDRREMGELLAAGYVPCSHCGRWTKRTYTGTDKKTVVLRKVYTDIVNGVLYDPRKDAEYNAKLQSLPPDNVPVCARCLASEVIERKRQEEADRCGAEFERKRSAEAEAYKEYRRSTAKERQRVARQNSRARAAGLTADLTIEEWIAVLDEHEHKCAYCGGPYECIEHKTPIIAGGGTTKDNVIPACNRCNADAYQQYRQAQAAD